MRVSIIRNLAVAALLSTTLMNGTIACDTDAVTLADTTQGIGKALHALRSYDITTHPEITPLLAKVDSAIGSKVTLHSNFTASNLLALIAYIMRLMKVQQQMQLKQKQL